MNSSSASQQRMRGIEMVDPKPRHFSLFRVKEMVKELEQELSPRSSQSRSLSQKERFWSHDSSIKYIPFQENYKKLTIDQILKLYGNEENTKYQKRSRSATHPSKRLYKYDPDQRQENEKIDYLSQRKNNIYQNSALEKKKENFISPQRQKNSIEVLEDSKNKIPLRSNSKDQSHIKTFSNSPLRYQPGKEKGSSSFQRASKSFSPLKEISPLNDQVPQKKISQNPQQTQKQMLPAAAKNKVSNQTTFKIKKIPKQEKHPYYPPQQNKEITNSQPKIKKSIFPSTIKKHNQQPQISDRYDQYQDKSSDEIFKNNVKATLIKSESNNLPSIKNNKNEILNLNTESKPMKVSEVKSLPHIQKNIISNNQALSKQYPSTSTSNGASQNGSGNEYPKKNQKLQKILPQEENSSQKSDEQIKQKKKSQLHSKQLVNQGMKRKSNQFKQDQQIEQFTTSQSSVEIVENQGRKRISNNRINLHNQDQQFNPKIPSQRTSKQLENQNRKRSSNIQLKKLQKDQQIETKLPSQKSSKVAGKQSRKSSQINKLDQLKLEEQIKTKLYSQQSSSQLFEKQYKERSSEQKKSSNKQSKIDEDKDSRQSDDLEDQVFRKQFSRLNFKRYSLDKTESDSSKDNLQKNVPQNLSFKRESQPHHSNSQSKVEQKDDTLKTPTYKQHSKQKSHSSSSQKEFRKQSLDQKSETKRNLKAEGEQQKKQEKNKPKNKSVPHCKADEKQQADANTDSNLQNNKISKLSKSSSSSSSLSNNSQKLEGSIKIEKQLSKSRTKSILKMKSSEIKLSPKNHQNDLKGDNQADKLRKKSKDVQLQKDSIKPQIHLSEPLKDDQINFQDLTIPKLQLQNSKIKLNKISNNQPIEPDFSFNQATQNQQNQEQLKDIQPKSPKMQIQSSSLTDEELQQLEKKQPNKQKKLKKKQGNPHKNNNNNNEKRNSQPLINSVDKKIIPSKSSSSSSSQDQEKKQQNVEQDQFINPECFQNKSIHSLFNEPDQKQQKQRKDLEKQQQESNSQKPSLEREEQQQQNKGKQQLFPKEQESIPQHQQQQKEQEQQIKDQQQNVVSLIYPPYQQQQKISYQDELIDSLYKFAREMDKKSSEPVKNKQDGNEAKNYLEDFSLKTFGVQDLMHKLPNIQEYQPQNQNQSIFPFPIPQDNRKNLTDQDVTQVKLLPNHHLKLVDEEDKQKQMEQQSLQLKKQNISLVNVPDFDNTFKYQLINFDDTLNKLGLNKQNVSRSPSPPKYIQLSWSQNECYPDLLHSQNQITPNMVLPEEKKLNNTINLPSLPYRNPMELLAELTLKGSEQTPDNIQSTNVPKLSILEDYKPQINTIDQSQSLYYKNVNPLIDLKSKELIQTPPNPINFKSQIEDYSPYYKQTLIQNSLPTKEANQTQQNKDLPQKQLNEKDKEISRFQESENPLFSQLSYLKESKDEPRASNKYNMSDIPNNSNSLSHLQNDQFINSSSLQPMVLEQQMKYHNLNEVTKEQPQEIEETQIIIKASQDGNDINSIQIITKQSQRLDSSSSLRNVPNDYLKSQNQKDSFLNIHPIKLEYQPDQYQNYGSQINQIQQPTVSFTPVTIKQKKLKQIVLKFLFTKRFWVAVKQARDKKKKMSEDLFKDRLLEGINDAMNLSYKQSKQSLSQLFSEQRQLCFYLYSKDQPEYQELLFLLKQYTLNILKDLSNSFVSIQNNYAINNKPADNSDTEGLFSFLNMIMQNYTFSPNEFWSSFLISRLNFTKNGQLLNPSQQQKQMISLLFFIINGIIRRLIRPWSIVSGLNQSSILAKNCQLIISTIFYALYDYIERNNSIVSNNGQQSAYHFTNQEENKNNQEIQPKPLEKMNLFAYPQFLSNETSIDLELPRQFEKEQDILTRQAQQNQFMIQGISSINLLRDIISLDTEFIKLSSSYFNELSLKIVSISDQVHQVHKITLFDLF